MITTALIAILYGALVVITSPLRILPDVLYLPGNISGGLSSVVSSLSILNDVFPISVLLYAFSVFLTIEAGIFSYKIIKWVYSKIPGIN
jgi:hypothetical protein